MDRKHNIRNISVVGQVYHGKSSLADSLLATAAVAEDLRMTNTHPYEAEYGTIKSIGVSLCYDMSEEFLESFKGSRDGNSFLINLINSPGHTEFSSEVTTALGITDGALVVVDCIEGVSLQTKIMLKQARDEQIRPVLIINKMDHFFELKLSGEEAYQSIWHIVEKVNKVIADYKDGNLTDGKCPR